MTLYSTRYLGNHPEYPRFVLYLMVFMVGMLGLTLADNLISLFVFWEVTTVSSYLLIGFNSDSAKSRRSALQALLLTGTGGLALLAGAILLGAAAGTYSLTEIRGMGDAIRNHDLYIPILILFLAGAFTKSAQFPFHFWLPNAMAAPTPVSAYLHSATMVKGGIYLMARMNPTLGGTEPWFWALVIAGGFTTVFASVLADPPDRYQTDPRLHDPHGFGRADAVHRRGQFRRGSRPRCYSSSSTPSTRPRVFLMIGIVDNQTGTRDVAHLRGLARKMPITFFAGALAAISMAGIPPFVGFIGKEFLYKAGLEAETASLWITGTIFAASVLMFVAGGHCRGAPVPRSRARAFQGHHGKAPWPCGSAPSSSARCRSSLAFSPMCPRSGSSGPPPMPSTAVTCRWDLYLFHGVNDAFILSLVTFATGFALYLLHGRFRALLAAVLDANPIKFDPGWDRTLDGLKALAAWQTGHLQSGILQRYIFITFATFAVAIGTTLYLQDVLNFRVDIAAEFDGLLFKHWAVLLFISAGALLTALTQSRMTAIAALGVVGIGVALIFIMFSAPDVAITQLLVETLVVVLVAVAMLKLPHLSARTGEPNRPRPRGAIDHRRRAHHTGPRRRPAI